MTPSRYRLVAWLSDEGVSSVQASWMMLSCRVRMILLPKCILCPHQCCTCRALRNNSFCLKPGALWWGISLSSYCFIYLKSVCTDLLGEGDVGWREEKRMFPNLTALYTPQYRYNRGETEENQAFREAKEKRKIQQLLCYPNETDWILCLLPFIISNTRRFDWIWTPLMKQGYLLSCLQ